jgi:hypothetical protein
MNILQLEKELISHREQGDLLAKKLEELKLSAKEEEFKVGDYYKASQHGKDNLSKTSHPWAYNGTIFRLLKFDDTKNDIGRINLISECGEEICPSWLEKATLEEIETHLIKEAEKKGFVKGAKVKAKGRNTRNCYSHQDFTLQDRQWYSDISGEIEEVRISKCNNVVIRLKSDVTLFLEASSFELIPSHPLIQIGKYQVEFKEDFITVGCKSINAPKIINLKKAIKEWNDCSSEVIRSLDIQGNTVTVEQIEEIAKHYSK